MSEKLKRLLNTGEAAEYLSLSTRTLENWRYQGRGPTPTMLGKAVRYDLKDLDAWIESHKKAG